MNSNTHRTTSYHVFPRGQNSKCHVDVSQRRCRMDKTNIGNMGKTMKNEQHIGSIKDLRPQKISNKLTFKLQRTANEYVAKRRRPAEEPQKGRNSCLRLAPRSVFGSFSVVLMSSKANFHVVRSALQNYSVYIFAGQVFYRSYVLRHIRLRSIFAWFCPCFQGWFCPSYIFFVRHQRDTWTLALSGTRNMTWFSECLSSMLEL